MKFPYIKIETITPDLRGFYLIDHDAYHKGYGISSSKVKRALQSYAHFAREEHDDSSALAFGRAFHAAILEPRAYVEDYVRICGHPNSNAFKAHRDAAVAAGKPWVGEDDARLIGEMIAVVKAHPTYAHLSKRESDVEVMGCYKCPETGLLLKCKMDLFSDVILDFKTTSGGVTDAEFTSSLVKYGYHVSAAFYQDIIRELGGYKTPFVIGLVSKKQPVECEFYQLSDDVLDIGRRLYKAALRRIAKWQALPDDQRPVAEKTLRLLNLNPRIVYSAEDTLRFIGEK